MTAVAAVDAGSNAIRLAMVDVGPTGIVTRKRSARYALRLGGEVFSKGRIASEHVPRLVAICRDIVRRMQRAGIERYRAVATSAMRDAQNGPEIADVIRRETGLELEIISGAEEGRIMRLTLTRALGSLSSDCLLVDLGGGSVELERTVETGGCSLPLGTVRLLHRYPVLQEPVSRSRLLEIGAALRDELATCLPVEAPAEVAIGTGGNLEALARIVPVARIAVPAIDVRRLSPVAARLARLTPAERARRFHLRADRADLILPAALLILALVDHYGLRLFVVPGTGIRESILYTLVTEGTRPSRARDLLRAQSHDLSMPERRTRMARRLFELLERLHGLWPPALAPLEAAAYLLDGSGLQDTVVSAAEAAALIRSSPELDLEERARAVAAHALGVTLGVRVPAGRIAPADLRVARVLAAILRLATALIEASDAWEPRVDLMRDPIEVEVGLRGWVTRADIAPLEAVVGRRIRVR